VRQAGRQTDFVAIPRNLHIVKQQQLRSAKKEMGGEGFPFRRP
jgi:hypothetical protein